MGKTLHIPPLGWAPRPHQVAIWEDMLREVRNILVVGHRRIWESGVVFYTVGARRGRNPAA